MTSFSSEVVVVTDPFHGGSDNRYSPIVKFNLNVSEYLTGTGPTSTVAILLNDNTYETRDEASDKLAQILAERDGQWDSREAILFMVGDPHSSYGSVLDGLFGQDDHFFLSESETFAGDDMYSLHSESHRKWLPAVATTTAGDSQEFLLGVPPTDATITLGALRRQVQEVAAEIAAGDGSEVYQECLEYKYEVLTNQHNWPEERGEAYTVWKADHDIVSGLPAGTVLDKRQAYGRYPDSGFRLRRWVENRDAALFTYENGAVSNQDRDNDGQVDRITYDNMVQVVRPIIAGEYSFDFKESTPYFQQCHYEISNPWTVNVTAPDGTLHEFFFDPVTVENNVAAGFTDGVLKPASFTGADGATSTISSLAWEPLSTSSEPVSGSVKVEVATSDLYAALDEHVLEFIETDGSVSLTLDVFDATLETSGSATGTLSWTLELQPWDAGDRLMVRIREAPLSCRSGEVIPNPRSTRDLVSDCEVLLGARDSLARTATLNWGLTTSMADWDGVRVGGTPRRVERLELPHRGLAGEIPTELGELSALTDLDLSGNTLSGDIPPELGGLAELEWLFLYGNRLSGEIPSELGGLSSLTRIYLQDNQLTGNIPPELGGLTDLFHLWLSQNRLGGTIPYELVDLTGLELLLLARNHLVGCVPQGLRDIDINDIASLGLSDCAHGLVSAPTGLGVSVGGGAFSLTWDAVTGAGLYEVHYAEGSGGAWDVIGTTTATSTGFAPDGGPGCGTTYRFRVRAYGDARTHAAGWGPESSEVSVTTGACNRAPEFSTSTYSFTIPESAATSTAVGSVSASDRDDDTLTYSIAGGNADGAFNIDGSTGEITVFAPLDHESRERYALTVSADDSRGGTATATVNIVVTDVAEDAPPAPTGLSASLTDVEFSLSWDAMAGVSQYEVQYRDDPAGDWDVISTTTATSTAFSPEGGAVCGTMYGFRVRAHGDGVTFASTWGFESSEEQVETDACNRAPVFSTSTYSFTVPEDAATSTVVGTVSASDLDQDDVYYSITGGNEDGRFGIGVSDGVIDLVGSLDHEDTSSYTLTVEASDRDQSMEGTATATVEISVTDVAEDLPPAPAGLSVTLEDGDFTLSWDVVEGASHYETQYRDGPAGDWEAIATTTATSTAFSPDGGPECGTAYEFRVRAYGDGTAYTAMWGADSDLDTVTTDACNRAPEFATTTYSFTIAEDAATSTVVGTVLASDPDGGDTVYYNILRGNGERRFAIDVIGGAIVLNRTLDHEYTSFYTLTVEASDRDESMEGTATATVEISVTDVAEDPPTAPTGLSVTLEGGDFTLSWGMLTGASSYEVQYRVEGSDADWESVATTSKTTVAFSPEGGPACGTAYEFQVRAYGDGTTYVAGWGPWSDDDTVTTDACNRTPGFGASRYSFSVASDAATSTAVGTVSATDPDASDTLTYSITDGNPGGAFTIDRSTGAIAIASTLATGTTPFRVLTVEVSDDRGGSASATVDIVLTRSECRNGTVVPRPADNPGLVRDCSLLLAGRDTLAGEASLNWSAGIQITTWNGVNVDRNDTALYLRDLLLTDLDLSGSIPAALGGLADLRRMDLDDNDLTGTIPPELSRLSNLDQLFLFGNRLSGEIPTELGGLGNLTILYLYDNELSGPIPPELAGLTRLRKLILDNNRLTGEIPAWVGDLDNLQDLWLRDNQLTGPIPTELESLPDLRYLYLEGNALTGCIPSGLRGVENNDLDLLGLEYCGSE